MYKLYVVWSAGKLAGSLAGNHDGFGKEPFVIFVHEIEAIPSFPTENQQEKWVGWGRVWGVSLEKASDHVHLCPMHYPCQPEGNQVLGHVSKLARGIQRNTIPAPTN